MEDVNVWGVGDVNFSPAVSLFRISFRPRHEWVKNPELTANFGSTGFMISHGGRSDEAPKRAGWCRNYRNRYRYILQNEFATVAKSGGVAAVQRRGVPHVTPGIDIITCFLPGT